MSGAQLIHWWQGATRPWYIHTVFPLLAAPEFDWANYIAARPRWDGTREPFYIGETGDGENRLNLSRHEKLRRALALGATELHVHLLARSRQERLDVETDLRNGHWTPLNEQPTLAGRDSIGALATLSGYNSPPTPGFDGISALATLSKYYSPPTPGFGDIGALSYLRSVK